MSKDEIEQKFDQMWESGLKAIAPRTQQSLLASPVLGFPKGARIMLCLFVNKDGFDLAITLKYVTLNGHTLGGRTYHPTGVMVDGTWWYH